MNRKRAGGEKSLIVKSVPFSGFEIKADSDDGYYRFEGYASTFGNEDSYGDTIMPGAFKKSIQEKFAKGKIKVLWQHHQPFGMPEQMYEDSRGLYVVAKISKSLSYASDYIELMREGVVDSMSIGFTIPKGKSEWIEDEDGRLSKRYIRECNLFEFSAVTFPANDLAAVESVHKHAELAALLEGGDAEKVLKYARSFEGMDVERVSEAVDVLRGALMGEDMEAKATLGGAGEPDGGEAHPDTPEGEGEQSVSTDDPDVLKAFQSAIERWREEEEIKRALLEGLR